MSRVSYSIKKGSLMATAPAQEVRSSPWLSVWLKPRDTIQTIVATNPRKHVFLLAGLGAAFTITLQMVVDATVSGSKFDLLDWRVVALFALAAAIGGVVNLYVTAFCMSAAGRMLGSRASAVEIRAAVAWSAAPCVAGLVIGLLFLFWQAGSEDSATVLASLITMVVVALIVWAWIMMMLMLARVQGFGFWRAAAGFILGYVLLFALALLIRTFAFQTFNTPASSMAPALLVGDNFVSKFSYGYTGYSFPFSPPRLFAGRVFASTPERGDVVVFRIPKDDAANYIKRVIGLPGDRIQMIKGQLHINGTPVQREQIDSFVLEEGGFGAFATRVKQWRETLPNGVSYNTLDLVESGYADNTQVYTVPPDHYFMMGDNRDNSTDSRFPQMGTVPFDNIVGKASRIFLSFEKNDATKKKSIRLDRIGLAVR